MLFLGFISGKRIRFPGKLVKTLNNPGSLTSTQLYAASQVALPAAAELPRRGREAQTDLLADV